MEMCTKRGCNIRRELFRAPTTAPIPTNDHPAHLVPTERSWSYHRRLCFGSVCFPATEFFMILLLLSNDLGKPLSAVKNGRYDDNP